MSSRPSYPPFLTNRIFLFSPLSTLSITLSINLKNQLTSSAPGIQLGIPGGFISSRDTRPRRPQLYSQSQVLRLRVLSRTQPMGARVHSPRNTHGRVLILRKSSLELYLNGLRPRSPENFPARRRGNPTPLPRDGLKAPLLVPPSYPSLSPRSVRLFRPI